MLFSSPEFFVFFAIYFALHLAIPRQYRIYLIIAGSTIFYAWWKLDYVWLPYLLMLTAYLGGRWTAQTSEQPARRHRAIATVVVLFIPLVFYKYTNFIYRDVFGPFFGIQDNLIDVALPLGVSFVTFTLTAYIVDIYNDRFSATHPSKSILAYVLFFPHLIAGPILRPHELVPQLERPRAATMRRFAIPLAIFTLGLVKKLVFADQIADVVNPIYGQATPPSAPYALLAILGFAVQIYCDFSGYTDMAIGLAAMLGIALPNNFRRPYTSLSISEVWRRWHMTLMRFLSDYVYSPISLTMTRYALRKRTGKWTTFFLTIVLPVNCTFFVSGIWHGAGWNFIMFGVITGIAMSIEFAWRRARMPELPTIAAWILTMLTFLISICFFRARTLGKAVDVLLATILGAWTDVGAFVERNLFAILLIVVFAVFHPFDDHRRVKILVRRARLEIVWIAIALCWIIAITVSQGSSGRFVYFDF